MTSRDVVDERASRSLSLSKGASGGAGAMVGAGVRRCVLIAAGIVMGAVLAPLEVVGAAVRGLAKATGRPVRDEGPGARFLDALVRCSGWRLTTLFGGVLVGRPTGNRAAAYLAARFPLALLDDHAPADQSENGPAHGQRVDRGDHGRAGDRL